MNEPNTLVFPVPPDAEIIANAIKATLEYSDVNDACPYPFKSDAGNLFRNAFNAERDRQNEHIVKEAEADVGQRANVAFKKIIAELQHPNSIKSDALPDTSDTIPQTEAEAEDALQTAFATAILAGVNSIQPIYAA